MVEGRTCDVVTTLTMLVGSFLCSNVMLSYILKSTPFILTRRFIEHKIIKWRTFKNLQLSKRVRQTTAYWYVQK